METLGMANKNINNDIGVNNRRDHAAKTGRTRYD